VRIEDGIGREGGEKRENEEIKENFA